MSISDFFKKTFGGVWETLGRFGIDEILETIGEKSGLLHVTRDEHGNALKRRLFGLGPEDEMLVLLAWYLFFVEEGLIKENVPNQFLESDYLNLDAALDSLEYIKKLKIRAIIGMREKEVHSIIKDSFTKAAKKGEADVKIVEKISQMKNVDGKKVLTLLMTIMKIGEKNGGVDAGKKAVVDFLNGTIFIPVGELIREAAENLGKTVESVIIERGGNPVQVLTNLELDNTRLKAELLARRAARAIRNP
jgi:hypothetical protein